MNRLKELREKKGSLVYQMKDIANRAAEEKRMMTEDESRQFDAWDNELNQLDAEIRRLEKVDSLAEPTREPEPQDVNKRYSEAFRRYVMTGSVTPELMQGYNETRTTQSGQNTTTTTGGYLVPTELGNKIIESLSTISTIRDFATVITTKGGNTMAFPTNDDTSNKGRILAEETVATETLTSFGTKSLGAYLFHSDIVPVSIQLLQDAAFNVEEYILNMLMKRVARGEDYYYILGNGSTEPNGIETAATNQGAYMAKTAVTRSTILDLIHSINAEYRKSPKAAFAMADSTLKVIKKLAISSSDDRSLWQPDFTTGEPGTIEGYKYFINDNIDAFGTAGNKPMFFGDWSHFYIRDVQGLTMTIFLEKFMASMQRGYQLWHRSDSELMNTAAIKHAVCAAT